MMKMRLVRLKNSKICVYKCNQFVPYNINHLKYKFIFNLLTCIVSCQGAVQLGGPVSRDNWVVPQRWVLDMYKCPLNKTYLVCTFGHH